MTDGWRSAHQMIDDLVKRLRAEVPYSGKSRCAFLCHEAADTIEAQAAEIERLKIECQAQYHRGYYDGRVASGDAQ